jgi:hypothetical protein
MLSYRDHLTVNRYAAKPSSGKSQPSTPDAKVGRGARTFFYCFLLRQLWSLHGVLTGQGWPQAIP